jgi:hypothetical protein
MTPPEENPLLPRLLDRFGDYRHKLVVLRQISSNKASRSRRWDSGVTLSTIAVSLLLSLLGFTGLARIRDYLLLFLSVSPETVEIIYNFLVFMILLITVVSLRFRFQDHSNDHQKAIVMLTALITDIDDILCIHRDNADELRLRLIAVNDKYKFITDALPPHSDPEYRKAKEDIAQKEALRLVQRGEQKK